MNFIPIPFDLYWQSVAQPLFWLLVLIAAEFILGVITALVQGKFDFDLLPDFLMTKVPPVLFWLVFALLAFIPAELIPEEAAPLLSMGSKGLAWIAYAAIFLKAVKGILQHFVTYGLVPDLFAKFNIQAKLPGDEDRGHGAF